MHARINISIFSCSFAFYSLIDSYMHTCTHAHMHIVHCFSVTTQRSPDPCAPPHSTKNATAALGRLVLVVLQRRSFGTTLVLHCRCFVLCVFGFPKCSSGNLFHCFISVFHFFVLTHFHCFACSHFFVGSIATKPSCRHTDPRCGVVPATPGTEGGQQPCVNRPRFVGVGKRMSLVV